MITNLIGVAAIILSTNYSHTVTRELPCHLCDTPHAFELHQARNVWRRRTVQVLGDDGKLKEFELGKPVVIHVLMETNHVQLHHPHAMPVPTEWAVPEGVARFGVGQTNPVLERLERFDPKAPGPYRTNSTQFAPRQTIKRAYVAPVPTPVP